MWFARHFKANIQSRDIEVTIGFFIFILLSEKSWVQPRCWIVTELLIPRDGARPTGKCEDGEVSRHLLASLYPVTFVLLPPHPKNGSISGKLVFIFFSSLCHTHDLSQKSISHFCLALFPVDFHG